MKAKNQVAKEVAESEFVRFCETMDIDCDTSGMKEEDRDSFDVMKGRVVGAICDGSLTIDGEGVPVFRPKKSQPETIRFPEPKGAALMAMDGRKKGQDVSKMYAVMAEITGVDAKMFALMLNRDLKIVQAIVTLFLA